MSRDTAKGFYDKNPGDPESGYVTPADAQAALDVVYDDMQADVGGADAINAKLGTAPQGWNSTVQERLEQIEAGANLAAQSVTSDKIANGAIVDADINAGAAIAPGKIAGTAVTRSDTGTVTSAMIENETIFNSDINGAAAIDKSKIAGTAIVASDSGTVTSGMLAANAVGAAALADNAVDTAAIQSKAVTAAKIADDTITAAQIAANAVGASELADNAVDTAAIQDDAVTAAKIATGAISADLLALVRAQATFDGGSPTTTRDPLIDVLLGDAPANAGSPTSTASQTIDGGTSL